MLPHCQVSKSQVKVFTVPTDAPEADGTYAWDSTTMVLVSVEAGGTAGIGYTYADAATGKLAQTLLEKVVHGREAFEHGAIRQALYRYVRNLGETGITAMAISSIDNALWDLRARLLDVPLVKLLGMVRPGIPVYGSGGFTSYDDGPARAPTRWLGCVRFQHGEDEGWYASWRRPAARGCCASIGRRCDRVVR